MISHSPPRDSHRPPSERPPAVAARTGERAAVHGRAGYADLSRTFRRVAWSRGAGCSDIATLLASTAAIRVTGDLQQSCVADRIDALVTRRLSSFDLVPLVVPHHVVLDGIRTVTAAVGGGPHSNLAVAIAARIAAGLKVPAVVAAVYRTDPEEAASRDRLAGIKASGLDIGTLALNGSSALDLLESLDRHTLLVVGAPGGSWLQRHLFGTGHQLTVRAPGGALVVRTAARRCYQEADDPTGTAVGAHLLVEDARQLIAHPTVPVAHGGRLVGVVHSKVLSRANGALPVAAVMEPPRSVTAEDPIAAADTLRDLYGDSPVPVVDSDGTLLGTITPSEIERSVDTGETSVHPH